MDFDYKTAWRQLAKPAHDALPKEILDLWGLVTRRCKDLHQLPDTSMPWPSDDGGELQAMFDDMKLETLALAARTIYFYGHWAPSGTSGGATGGSHWKFSHYADQTLRKTLIRKDEAHFYQIHEGCIRVCISGRDYWQWEEVALASDIDLVREEVKKLTFSRDSFELNALKLLHRTGLANPVSAPWLEKDKFMTPTTDNEKLLAALRAVPRPAGWYISGVVGMNYKPHPYTIGPKHMKSGSFTLDTTIGCAHRKDKYDSECGLPASAHTNENAVSLLYLGDEEPILKNGFVPQEWLVELKKVADGKVEGFMFPNCRTAKD